MIGTYSKFAVKNNFLSLCARRSHRHGRAALLRTLRWLSKYTKKIRRGCRTKQVGSWNEDVIFLFDITSGFCYVLVAISMMEIATTMRIFGNTAGFDRVGSVSFICNVAKLTRERCIYNSQYHNLKFATCSKDVACVAYWGGLRMSWLWDPRFDSHGMLCSVITRLYLISFLAFWEYDCFPKIALSGYMDLLEIYVQKFMFWRRANPEPFSRWRRSSLYWTTLLIWFESYVCIVYWIEVN